MDNFANYSGTWREVHVSYLQIAVEGGVGALVFYLLFFGRGFGNLKRLRRMSVNDPEIDLFSGALYASLVGFVVGAFFAPEAYQYFPYFAVAYTSVLLAMVKEREQGTQQATAASLALSSPSRRRWNEDARADGFGSARVLGGSEVPAVLPRNRP
jgi:O-antigen ligase